jgi:hypothetical protein
MDKYNIQTHTIRDILFSDFIGCTNHDCVITGPKKGMGTNGSCSCLHNMSRSQLNILKSRLSQIADKTVEVTVYNTDSKLKGE